MSLTKSLRQSATSLADRKFELFWQ